jgi:aldose 1-epimerase
LLSSSKLWQISTLTSDGTSARVTSRLEFWRHPELMAQWPFAEEYEMSYILSKDGLQVETKVTNRSAEPMPVTIGFHPYYRIPGERRDNWSIRIPARKAVVANKQLIPTGEYKPVDFADPLSLKGRILDDGFTDLQRDAHGRANFTIAAGSRSIHISFGPNYPVAILWNPPVRGGPENEFMCVEPMTGVTDAINLHHAGKYPDLQMLAPGKTWVESFWVQPQGFE